MPEMVKLSADSLVCTAQDVVSSQLADEIVILDLKSGVYHGLDGVGARVWELVGDATPIRTIHDALVDEYDVDPAQCEEDLLWLIGDLESHGLVRISDQPNA